MAKMCLNDFLQIKGKGYTDVVLHNLFIVDDLDASTVFALSL